METTKDIVNEIRTFAKHSSWVSPGTLREFADRIEAATAELRDENAKLKAALKPVLDIVMDGETSDIAMAAAIDMACWIYKEGESK